METEAPCACPPEHEIDHSEFGLPLGFNRRCLKCGRMWASIQPITTMTTPDNITKLEPNEVFVFGSNISGIHGAGAAKTAAVRFGAIWGQGSGPTGQCYAIPTKDHALRTLPLTMIGINILAFLHYARDHPAQTFLVTQIGCGLAGYSPRDIAPLFGDDVPANVVLPASFILGDYSPGGGSNGQSDTAKSRGSGWCDACGEYTDNLMVIDQLRIAGLCSCQRCAGLK